MSTDFSLFALEETLIDLRYAVSCLFNFGYDQLVLDFLGVENRQLTFFQVDSSRYSFYIIYRLLNSVFAMLTVHSVNLKESFVFDV